jgi:predicted O-methyltransferase YrrM
LYDLKQFKPEVATPTPECPNPEKWHCHDGMATEIEVVNLLGALVSALKPITIIETGMYLGHATRKMANALAANGLPNSGLYTTEPDDALYEKGKELIASSGLSRWVAIHKCTGFQLINRWQGGEVDFAFLDSTAEERPLELRALYPLLSKRAVVTVHDTSTYHDSVNRLRTNIYKTAWELNMSIMQFDTPRGLTLLKRIQ